MADADRNIIEIIVQGAEQSVRQIQSVALAQSDLAVVQESAGTRQRVVYDSVAKAAQAAAQAEETAAKQAQEAVQKAEEAKTATIVAQAAKQAEARRQAAAAQVAPQVQQQIRQTTFPTPSNLTPQRLQVAVDAAQFTAARNAIVAQQAAAQTLQGRLAALGQTIAGVVTQMSNLARNTGQATTALNSQAGATGQAGARGVTYLSVLSAIHAASFLATNQTFSMIGSFATLGVAFGKMGVAAGAAGLALGGILALFGQVTQTAAQIQQAVIAGAETLLKFGAGAVAAAVAAGGASVKLASSVETQLASVKAFGGATNDQLQSVEKQASDLAVQFGVSAASVVEATSLFARAGGTVKDALDGATEAIVKLQIASQGELSAAQSAIVVSAALKQFQLTGADAGRVADNLAAAMQGSALSALGVQQAFIQAAPGAHALGISIEDLSTAIALIGNQLVKGTITGTAFKQAILDLINPTAAAQKIYAQYGVSVTDTNGKLLPLIDIAENLNKAFGKMVDSEGNVIKEQDAATIAAIGGARAFLALNVITEGGASEFQKYRDALNKVTTSDIVSTLLQPLAAQMGRLQQAATEVGRAFGGPFLGGLATAASAAADFVAGLRGIATTAGQAIASLASGQGFAALSTQIDELTGHNAGLSSFFIELANSGRNVVNVITGQIIPAIQDFISMVSSTISSATGLDEIGSAFDTVNVAIAAAGAAAGTAIRNFGTLVSEMITGTGVGGVLRNTILDLGRAILTNMAAALTTAIVSIQAAIVAMPVLARGALLAAQAALALSNAFEGVATAAINASKGAQIGQLIEQAREIQTSNPAKADELLRQAKALETQANEDKASLNTESEAARALAANIQTLLGQVDKLPTKLADLGKVDPEALRIARTSISDLVDEIVRAENINVEVLTQDEVNKLVERAGAMKEGARQQLGGILTVVDDLQGQLPTQFDNIIQQIQESVRAAQDAARNTGTAAPPPVDTKALDAQTKKITEAANDLNRRLANLVEDAGTKAAEAASRALERLDDVFTGAKDRLDTLVRDTAERIKDLQDAVDERRADRNFLQPIQQANEDALTSKQRELDKEATEEQRTLERIRTLRQQHTQDIETETERQFQFAETIRQREIESEQHAFDRIQQIRSAAFSRSQDAELTAFQRSQQAAAEARQFALSLAQAKTPEDLSRLTVQHTQGLQDTKFQQGQEDALTKFRQAQEDKRTKFQQDQEAQTTAFRQGQEDKFTKFRQDQEDRLTAYKRQVAAREQFFRDAEDDVALSHREAREDSLLEYRRQKALEFQDIQDKLEDAALQRSKDKVTRKANEAADRIITDANKQAQKIQDALDQQQAQQLDDVTKQMRNMQQVLDDLADSVPPELQSQILPKIAAAKADLATQQAQALLAITTAQTQNRNTVDQAIAVGQAQLELNRPQFGPQAPQTTPEQVAVVQTMQVANLLLPAGFWSGLTPALLDGLRQAKDEGTIPDVPTIDLGPLLDDTQAIRRVFRG